DITERKQAEEETKLMALFAELNPAPVLRFDEDGRVLMANKAAHELLGGGLAPGVSLASVLPSVGGIDLAACIRDGAIISHLVDVADRHFLFAFKGVPDLGIGQIYGSDISERMEAERSLRDQEKHFRALIENSHDVTGVLSGDGTIRYESPSIEHVLGYRPEELVGTDAFALIHPDDAQGAAEIFGQIMEDPSQIVQAEVRFRHKNGVWRNIEATGQNLLDDPAVNGIVVNYRDVTERKQAEEEKQRIEQQLQLSGRLAAVGELAAGVAHELNNPLTAVQGFAELLTSRQDLDESMQSDVETIYREAKRAAKITSNLLSFARKHNPEKRLISLNEVIEKSLELHTYRLRVNNIEIETELDPVLPMTMADFHQMQQVCVNVVTNAEQAMTEAKGEGRISIRTVTADGFIRMEFSDDGPGIPEENLKRLFDPFFTTKGVGQGTGLGLWYRRGSRRPHTRREHAR
ncbi:MAG: PAS domain S-box protein, partial [Dehalococcoidia bacterium]